jgi:paired amphipathic helix protein Sin3a
MMQNLATLQGTASDRLLFFDRAKKSLEGRELYDDFLKLLDLFSKDVINMKMLVQQASTILDDQQLLTEFKELIGWDDRDHNVENGPPGSIRTGPPEALSALPAEDGEGPSYRKLPESVSSLVQRVRETYLYN